MLEVFFQCTQTGQSSNDSPWFFDLNPLLFTCSTSNEYLYNGVAQFCVVFTEYLLCQTHGVFPLNSNREPSNDSPRFFDMNPLFWSCNE